MKQVRETAAGQSISAYVVLDKRNRHVATVQSHYGNAGRVTVDCFHTDGTTALQQSSAGGGGYDKFAAALAGMTIDGHVMSDHCGMSRKPPKQPDGGRYFPTGYKPPTGWSLANFSRYRDGKRVCMWDIIEEIAIARHGADWQSQSLTDEQWQAIQRDARQACEALPGGYSSCFREAGLDYLTAIGYRVIRAI